MPQIRQVVSEALQKQIRDLLPSQQGFTEDLQATNVITPVIDLTSAAEGSGLSVNLQTALAHGSITSFNVSNTTSTLVNNTGFYRVFGVNNGTASSANNVASSFSLSDGLTSKIIVSIDYIAGLTDQQETQNFDFVVFLAAGESLTATTNNAYASLIGCTRQIADVNGNLVNPSGFTVS